MNNRILLALVALTAAQLPPQLAAITGNRGVSMGHLQVVVRDVDASDAGCRFRCRPANGPQRDHQVAFLYDPWGTYIERTQGLSPSK